MPTKKRTTASTAKRPKARAQVKAKPAAPKKAAKAMDMDAMMAAWQKASTPSDGHRRLEPMAGTFRAKTTFTMSPADPPQVSDGSSDNRWVLGGRYLQQTYKGSSMGMPFEGIGFTGYDNVQKKYVGTWMDNFGTGLMNSLGVGKPSDGALDFESSCFQPSGDEQRFWCKIRVHDRDRHTYEMWSKAPNGKKFRTMMVEYTRS